MKSFLFLAEYTSLDLDSTLIILNFETVLEFYHFFLIRLKKFILFIMD